jgi:peptidoglycan/xylan/chitin deacetylase (PgdA/CDA1 family)
MARNLERRARNGACWLLATSLIARGYVKKAKHESFQEGVITPICFHSPGRKLFRKIVVWLKDNGYTFVSAGQLIEIYHGRIPCPRGAVWISVDDGWRRNIDNVIPTVVELDIPITIFVGTAGVEDGIFWWTKVKQFANHLPNEFRKTEAIVRLPEDSRRQLLELLNQAVAQSTTKREAMTVEDIAHISAIPQVTIGSHTVSHPVLPNCTDDQIDYELRESKRKLEDWTGKSITAFGYPGGHVDDRERQFLQKHGYELAATTEKRHANSNGDCYLIPRIEVVEDGSLRENLCRLLGIWKHGVGEGKRIFKPRINKVSSGPQPKKIAAFATRLGSCLAQGGQRVSRKLERIRESVHRRLHAYLYSLRTAVKPTHKRYVPVSPVDETRASWENAFLSLWGPVISSFSKGKAFVSIDGPRISSAGTISDGYEGFARTFIGVAFYLHRNRSSVVTLSNGDKVDMAAIYREGIVNGTNPRHREFWGRIKSNERLVENCSVALGLLLTREHIWDRLSADEKHNVAAWFRDGATKGFYNNNWQWFRVFHYVFLEQMGYEFDSEDLERTLGNIEKMYCQDGWYTDGIREEGYRYDYYVPWAMHFYSLLFCYLAGENHREWKQKYMKRSRQFLRDYQYFFTPRNHPPLYGRSQLYRFASLAPWGVSLLLDCCDADIDWLKTSAIDTVNTFLAKGAAKEDGILSMGYHREFTPMLEAYSGPASPYWAFKGFSFLLLPENHRFWSSDIGKAKPKELVHPIEATRMVLLHSGDSHVIMLNVGSNADDPIKYNKFAYSNVFLMNYDRRNPIDNTLLLRSENDAWSCRRTIMDSSCDRNICNLRWKTGDTILKTTLVGERDGYVAVHQLCGGSRLLFQTGGFPIAKDSKDIKQEITEDEVTLQGDKGQVGIKLLFGKARPFVYHRRGVNPEGEFSFVPCFRGTFGDTKGIIVFAVWAAASAGAREFPLVTVNERMCIIKWQHQEHQVVLD